MGFDQRIFLNQQIDDNLICAICCDVLETPTSACSEGHTFCKDCLNRTISHGGGDETSVCPTCRGPILSSLALNRPLHNIIQNLQVCCGSKLEKNFISIATDDSDDTEESEEFASPAKKKQRASEDNKGAGPKMNGGDDGDDDDEKNMICCTWEGRLSDLETHKSSCSYTKRKCPLGCRKELVARDMQEHKKECKYRTVACELCHKVMKAYRLVMHTRRLCPNAKVLCRFCGEEMLRKELGTGPGVSVYARAWESHPGSPKGMYEVYTGHYETCPKIPLRCEFYNRGCHEELTRETIGVHHAEKAQYHAHLVDRSIKCIYRHLDWELVNQLKWKITASEFVGQERKTLKSCCLPVTIWKLYLKLQLHGQNDAIKVSICADNPHWAPVEIDRIHVSVGTVFGDDHGNFELEEETKLKAVSGSDDHEFSFKLKHDRYMEGSDSGSEFIEENVEMTRSDLIGYASQGEVFNNSAIYIKARFGVKKLANAVVKSR